jgi:hypothetical protein
VVGKECGASGVYDSSGVAGWWMMNKELHKLQFCVPTGLECVFCFKCVCLKSLFIRDYSVDCLPSLFCFLYVRW